MKNVLVVLTLMLMSSLAFAGTEKKAETQSAADEIIENVVVGDGIELVDGYSYAQETDFLFEDCTVKMELTITDRNGNPTKVEGTVTIVGKSCVQVLKEAMSK